MRQIAPHSRRRPRRRRHGGCERGASDPRRARGRAVCPTCKTTLADVGRPVAERMRAFVRAAHRGRRHEERDQGQARRRSSGARSRRAAGPRLQPARLAPADRGRPAAVVAVAFLARRWSRTRAAPAADPSVDGRRPLDPELERRVDEELARFESRCGRATQDPGRIRRGAALLRDSLRAAARARLPRDRLRHAAGRGGTARRDREPPVHRGVHGGLRRSRRARRRGRGALADDRDVLLKIAGFVLVALGFAFMGFLPIPSSSAWPRPGCLDAARRRGSSALLGGAFGLCAAPCIGPVLASILALASDSSTVGQGSLLLLVYSAGLAVPFLLVGIGFDRAASARFAGYAITTRCSGS